MKINVIIDGKDEGPFFAKWEINEYIAQDKIAFFEVKEYVSSN